jgi:hypothetical protein
MSRWFQTYGIFDSLFESTLSSLPIYLPTQFQLLEDNMIAHPAARTITQEQKATIYYHLDENIPPRQIISLIKKSDPAIVYNLRKSFLKILST